MSRGPKREELPFFAYGIFRTDEIAYPQLAPYVKCVDSAQIKAEPWLRDGVLLLARGDHAYAGHLLIFDSSHREAAYAAIAALEPDHLYRWDEADVIREDGAVARANVLFGKNPHQGGERHFSAWSSRNDPLFNEALEVVEETYENAGRMYASNTFERFFRLQMGYLLLWAAIERYATLRWGFQRDGVWQRVKQLAQEPAFISALQRSVTEPRTVRRADDPSEIVRLDPGRPGKAVAYYYQVRSNIIHRGKGRITEREHLEKSLPELLAIFKTLLQETLPRAASG